MRDGAGRALRGVWAAAIAWGVAACSGVDAPSSRPDSQGAQVVVAAASPQAALDAGAAGQDPQAGGPPPTRAAADLPASCRTFCDVLVVEAERCLADAGQSWGPELAGSAEASLASPETYRQGCLRELVADMTAEGCDSSMGSLKAGRLGCRFISPKLFGSSLPAGAPGQGPGLPSAPPGPAVQPIGR